MPWDRPRSAIGKALIAAGLCWIAGTAAAWALGVRGSGQTAHPFQHLPFVDIWLRWDAGWYRAIAQEGYFFSAAEQSSVAYFPLYPLAIRALTWIGLDPFLAGIGLSFSCGLWVAWTFDRWARAVAPEHAALGTWCLLLWPFAFFLYGAMYSDGLFLALVLSAFLALERRVLWAAALAAALATATRPLAPALVLGLWLRHLELRRREGRRLSPPDAVLLFAGAGLATYMAYLGSAFDNPLAFLDAQAGWKQLPGPATWFKLKLLGPTYRPEDWLLPGLHAALTLLLLWQLPAIAREIGWGYAAYVALVLGLPLIASRDFIGLGRYALAAFPCFLALAHKLHGRPWRSRLALGASAVVLVVMTVKFAMGRYVS